MLRRAVKLTFVWIERHPFPQRTTKTHFYECQRLLAVPSPFGLGFPWLSRLNFGSELCSLLEYRNSSYHRGDFTLIHRFYGLTHSWGRCFVRRCRCPNVTTPRDEIESAAVPCEPSR